MTAKPGEAARAGAAEERITALVLASFAAAPDPRLRRLLEKLVEHLHAFAREVELSEEEWFSGIRFLTETGQTCDGLVRQEFILLSDVLGLSMLVDALGHRGSAGITESTVFGPFYIAGMPARGYGENMAFTAGVPALVLGGCWTRKADRSPAPAWMSGRARRTAVIPGRTRVNPTATCVADTLRTARDAMRSAASFRLATRFPAMARWAACYRPAAGIRGGRRTCTSWSRRQDTGAW